MTPFPKYQENRLPFLEVIGLHKEYADRIPVEGIPAELHQAARDCWCESLDAGRRWGYRNAQVTVLAPTGTIAFMMDCDTTGIEPDIALVKYKQLVGGGVLKIVNRAIPVSLRNLGYGPDEVEEIVAYIDENDGIEGAPGLRDEHLPIFDCAFPSPRGVRSIHHMGHLRMMGAVQPFLSGGISKTVNMPKASSLDDVFDAYVEGWRLGLKSLAIYRDGSKRTQPLNTGKKAKKETAESGASTEPRPLRRKLPDVRQAVTHKFSISGHDGYLTVGLYEDGQPGEVFLKMAKEGSTISGLMDTVAIMTSIALQYGVPIKALVDKFSHTRFEPAGFTQNSDIPIAKSVMDYVFRWLGLTFLRGEVTATDPQDESDTETNEEGSLPERVVPIRGGSHLDAMQTGQEDAPPCSDCGTIMVRAGACYSCRNCGETGGCG
jgi:ribonucleoside-diphosphate reductase alpha chain